jgi:hypothetical protein
MEFDINNADEVMDAKKDAMKIAIFKADDEYIKTLVTDNILMKNSTCQFTQILKIDSMPDYLDDDVVIHNAIHIMKFYDDWKNHACKLDDWAVFTTTDLNNAQSALQKSITTMKGEKELYKLEDCQK